MSQIIKNHERTSAERTNSGVAAPHYAPASSSSTGATRILFNLEDVGSKANAYLDKVRQQSKEILDVTRKQAEDIRKKAEADGRQAAIAAVEKVMDDKVGKHMQTLLPALNKAVVEITAARHAWEAHWHQAAIQLATAIAAQIIRREVAQSPEITLDLIAEALRLAAGRDQITLRLNPIDLQNLGGQVAALRSSILPLAEVSIVGDPLIVTGGCRVDTQFGSIDQQFNAQLARIEAELLS